MRIKTDTTNSTSTAVMAESEKETYLQRVIKRSESAYYYNDPSLFNTSNFNATEGVTEFKVKLRKCFEPKKVLSLEKYKCIKIACGCAHTLALAKDGTLLSRGIQRSWTIRKHDANQFAIISKSRFFVQYEF